MQNYLYLLEDDSSNNKENMGASYTSIDVNVPVITGMDDGEFSDNEKGRSEEERKWKKIPM